MNRFDGFAPETKQQALCLIEQGESVLYTESPALIDASNTPIAVGGFAGFSLFAFFLFVLLQSGFTGLISLFSQYSLVWLVVLLGYGLLMAKFVMDTRKVFLVLTSKRIIVRGTNAVVTSLPYGQITHVASQKKDCGPIAIKSQLVLTLSDRNEAATTSQFTISLLRNPAVVEPKIRHQMKLAAQSTGV